MTAITKYLLGTLLFSSINFFGMENPDQPTQYTTITMETPEHTKPTTFRQEIKSIDKIINLEIKKHVEAVHDMLDTKLGVNTNFLLRPLMGSIKSCYETTNLSQQEICEKMNLVGSCLVECSATENITPDTRKKIFHKLSKKHLFVHCLKEASIQEHIEKFSNVTCSTLNQLLNPDVSNDPSGIKKIIHKEARKNFINDSGIRDSIRDIPYDKSGDIHFIVLYGHTNQIKSKSMIMSEDGKYLKTKDKNKNTIIWNTKEGEQVPQDKLILLRQNTRWLSIGDTKCDDYIVDEKNNYAAFNITSSGIRSGKNYYPSSITDIKTTAFPIEIDTNKPAIILFKRPTIQSYLCQKAFNRSRNNHEQLNSLLMSLNDFKKVKGFPRKNLEQLISKRITELTKQ